MKQVILSTSTKQTIVLENHEILSFCGNNDQRIRQLQDGLGASILARGNELQISGTQTDVKRTTTVIEDLLSIQRKNGKPATEHQIKFMLREALRKNGSGDSAASIFHDTIPLPGRVRQVGPMTHGQKHYVDALRNNDVVFAIGPAGTGKTYLAVAMAIWHLLEGSTRRIILVRPAVEAGERLGFLPGDIAAKFDPFVRPLYDALYDMMEPEKVREYLETGIIEIAPLAFMRGRTLNEAYVILDEGQNTTQAQMKMFLTRLGHNSRVVVTGDISQIDLPKGTESGLIHARKVLHNINGIKFIEFDDQDVVRHDLVQKVIKAYESYSKKQSKKSK